MDSSLSIKWKSRLSVFFLVAILGIFSIPLSAQTKITVSGTVTDNENVPMAGLSVVEKGTLNGVNADIDGKYSITVSEGAELEFSFLGYKTVTIPVSNRSQINVVMEKSDLTLDAVVAIGYGSTRKQDLSMAVTTIDMDEVSLGRPSNLATVLQGRIPGVTIQQSGDPMSSASFSIRGRGSKGNDGDPTSGDGVLFVVDGVPGAPFSVDDIESITILKDAASAAIYGASVGSSGVIMITTKKGVAGPVKVDLNVSFGFDEVTKLPKVLTAEQYNTVWAKAIENASGSMTIPDAANPAVYEWGKTTRTDWLDEIFRKGFKQHYSATISGGNQVSRSVLSLSFDDKKGVLLNTWNKSFNGKLQSEYQITKWLKAYERVSANISNGQGNVNTNHQGPIIAALWYPRSATVYDMNNDGTYILDAEGNKVFGGTSPSWSTVSSTPLIYNPVAELTKMHRLYPSTTVFSTTGIEIKPISSLTFKSEFTADYSKMEEDNFYPKMVAHGLQRAKNFREQFFHDNVHWLSENTITWAEIFGKHHISAMAGMTADWTSTHVRGVFTKDYNSEKLNELLWTEAQDYTSRKPEESIYEYAMLSFLGRIGYSFDDRYFLTASIRRDASSKLPISKNYDWFPAVSGSWKLTSEHFFDNTGFKNVFNLIKLRAGWGKIGNVNMFPSNVADVEMLTYQWPVILGKNMDVHKYGTYLSTIPNLNARWETTVQTSAGIDIAMLNNRLEMSVDWYHKETRDLIDYIPTPAHIGVSNPPLGNMGNVLNKGWELSLKYNGSLANGDFNYSLWGMWAINNGVVREYGKRTTPVRHDTPNIDSKSILYSQAGQPWYSFMVYKTDGIFRSQDEIDNYVYTNPETGTTSMLMPSAKPGDLKYVDSNNDGVINDADKIFAGSYAPKHTFSFGASLAWKGIDFSFMLQGVAGNYIYNGMKQLGMNARHDYGNLLTDVLDTWDFDHENSKYPRLGIAEDVNGNYDNFSDFFLEKGDYLRLKNITLGYTLPKFSKWVPGIRVYVSTDNAFTFTKYTGVDPEVGNYGVDRGVYPVTRFFNFGVNINF